MYQLIFDKKSLEELNKLDGEIKERIWKKLQLCKENPFRFVEKLTEIEGFKLRVGDYRAILHINSSKKVIIVEKVGHRKNIYDGCKFDGF